MMTSALELSQSKRETRREANVTAGLGELALWLRDLLRQGLSSVQEQPLAYWETMAARLVDAQAPAVAHEIRQLAQLVYTQPDWPEQLLTRLSLLHLLVEGHRHFEAQSPELQAEIRTLIGWTQRQAELLTQPGLTDRWLVLGQRVIVEAHLKTQRTWLWAEAANRPALILDFAHGQDPLDDSLTLGTTFAGEVVFFPGCDPQRGPQRGLVKSILAAAAPVTALPGHANIDAGFSAYAAAFSHNPWLKFFPLGLQQVWPHQQRNRWIVQDQHGDQLTLQTNADQGWRLLALSGGYPLDLFGEWDGQTLRPLAAWADGRYVALTTVGKGRQWEVQSV
jgi:hypothetical protein